MRRIVQAAVAAVLALLIFGVRANAQNINVVINGQPVAFTGAPPQELNGSVLVPLRGVFEQLGASVQFNPTTQTIFAQKGSTTVSLSLGSVTAYVNNQPQQLAQPPTVIVGTTLVPLRFVAEAFGAYVEWEAQTSTVEIQTSPSSAVPVGPPPAPQAPQFTTLHGKIVQVDNSQNPQQLTVLISDGQVEVNIDPHTRIDQRQHGSPSIPSAPQALQPGVVITAQVWPSGNARSIDIDYMPMQISDVTGRIVNIDNLGGPSLITIGTSSGPVQVGIDSHTQVFQMNGPGQHTNGYPVNGLRTGDDVTAEVWPSGTARSIQINFVENHGHVIAAQNLPNGQILLVLDNGNTVFVDQHASIWHSHAVATRRIQAGDSISVRYRFGTKSAYSVDIN